LKPETRNPQPATRNLQPATFNPQPATRNQIYSSRTIFITQIAHAAANSPKVPMTNQLVWYPKFSITSKPMFALMM
jgi:hypothetical protein